MKINSSRLAGNAAVFSRVAILSAALLSVAILSAVFLTSCGKGGKDDKKNAGTDAAAAGSPEAAEIPVFAVTVAKAERGQIADYLGLAGDIVAGSTVDAYSDAAGKVIRLLKSVGESVAYNEPVAQVDPSRPGMTYIANTVRSPIAGTIVALPAQVGMTVSQATPIARITGRGALEIKLYVAERFISKIALAQPCEVSLDAWPGEVFRGSVGEISPIVDPASRTMEIKVNVENQRERLKAGMFAKVKIITERHDGVVRIPDAARIERFGETYVYVIGSDPRDGAFNAVTRRSIKSGILVDGLLEVLEGLNPDEEVVIKGQSLLEDGARVNVIRS